MNNYFKPIIDIKIYTKMFQNYLGKKMYVIFLFSIVASLLEGFGILMLLPLLESIGNLDKAKLNDNALSFFLNNVFDYLGISSSTISVLFLILILFVLKGIITMVTLSINSYMIGELLKNIKENLFELYTKMSYSYYVSKNTGDFINLITEQPNRAIESFRQLILFGSHLINTIVLIILAFLMSSSFGILAIISGIILLILFIKMNSFLQKLSRINAKENSGLNKWLIQILHGFKYLVSTNQIKNLKKNIFSSINILTSNQIKSGIAAAFTQSVREPLAVVLIISIIYFQLVIYELSLEPILVSIALFYRALNSTLAVQSSLQATFQLIGSMEIIDNEYRNQTKNIAYNADFDLIGFKNDIIFKNVSFKYNNAKENCLTNINLKINSKSTVGIVGESGSGKTTLVDLITLLDEPSSGQIHIDGVSSKVLNKGEWRNNIGYISQDTVIFDDTIANNISMWNTNNIDLKQRLIEVAEQANIIDFINSLPNGFNTKVGDRGIQLSGGQKQRIFIARELFRKPSILILDEATSALDSKAEIKIQSSIENIKGEFTIIIIAHRISTIKHADKIFMIDKGELINSGTFNELKKKCEQFNLLISNQEV